MDWRYSVSNSLKISAPLTNCTKKGDFNWTKERLIEKSFQLVKNKLSNAHVLVYQWAGTVGYAAKKVILEPSLLKSLIKHRKSINL